MPAGAKPGVYAVAAGTSGRKFASPSASTTSASHGRAALDERSQGSVRLRSTI
jgi:hypothetical protein